MAKDRLVVLVGSTAVGKTKLSLDLAEGFNGEIISADSMQIYRDFDVGSAKATVAEQDRVKHHLISLVDVTDFSYNVHRWVTDAQAAISDIRSRGKLPIIVGGSHYFVQALLHPAITSLTSDSASASSSSASSFDASSLTNYEGSVGPAACPICFDEFPFETLVTLRQCGEHYYCATCLGICLTTHISSAELTQLACPSIGCPAVAGEEDIRKLTSAEVYDKYLRFLLLAFLDTEHTYWCPNAACSAPVLAAEIPCASSDTLAMFFCPSCSTAFCSGCSKPFHPGVSCDGVSAEDREFFEWLSTKNVLVKECYKCGFMLEKNDGCNHITCKCGAQWCWLCRAICESGHFQAPSRCAGLQFAKYNCLTERLFESEMSSLKVRLRQLKIAQRREWHAWTALNPRDRTTKRREEHVQAEGNAILARHEAELQFLNNSGQPGQEQTEAIHRMRAELDQEFQELKRRHQQS